MATKKKTTKVSSETKRMREDIRLLGKSLTELRKMMAGALGSISRLEDESRLVTELSKATAAKVKKLISDPLYAVPAHLEKKVAAFEVKQVDEAAKLTRKLNDLGEKLNDLRREASNGAAQQRAEATRLVTQLNDLVVARLEDLEGSVATLELNLGFNEERATEEKASEVTVVAADASGPQQVTIDEAIAESKAAVEHIRAVAAREDREAEVNAEKKVTAKLEGAL